MPDIHGILHATYLAALTREAHAEDMFDAAEQDSREEADAMTTWSKAKEVVEAARIAYLASDEERAYEVTWEDGGDMNIVATPGTIRGLVREATLEGEYGQHEPGASTCWVRAYYRPIDHQDGERDSVRVQIDPDEPDCDHEDGHDWQSPHEIVGGLKENPGVQGHGGGVVISDVCVRCGCGRTRDTWAQDRSTGEQGLESVAYAPGEYAEEVSALRASGEDSR